MSEPTFFYAPGTGIISSRTDWSPDATQVLFRAGPTRQSHDDRAQGAVLLFRNTWLVGTAKLQSHSGIDQSAIDWTTLTVDGKEQVWTQEGVSILRQEDTPAYTYAMADLTAAYAGQLSVFIREILFLKSNFLLIADGYVPVNPNSVVTWHLNSPSQPGILGSGFRAGQLFGVVIEPAIPGISSTSVKLDANQPIPTYRVDIAGDPLGHFLVAMEAAPGGQSGSTMGTPGVTPAVQGIRCGNAFVGWLAGGQSQWIYPSSTSGPHLLIGTPDTVYQTPAGTLTSTAGGLLMVPGLAVGQPMIINKGTAPVPPPPPPPPVVKTFAVRGTLTSQPDGSLVGMVTLEPQPIGQQEPPGLILAPSGQEDGQ